MRFFKHGDSLAIVLPERLRKRSDVSQDAEYEFVEIDKGVFAIVEKGQLEARVKQSIFAELLSRLHASDGTSAPISAIQSASMSPNRSPDASRTSDPSPAYDRSPSRSEASSSRPRSPPSQTYQPGAGNDPAASSTSYASGDAEENLPVETLLSKRGYATIVNEAEARLVSKALEQQIKGKQVFGVRGFDKKFYIVSEAYLNAVSPRLMAALGKQEAPLKELAAQAKTDEQGCLAVLQVLKEQGDIIEKRRGVFKSIA